MNLRIYPNPARDLIKLQLTSGTKDIIDVKIYDAKGSLVSSRSIAVNGGSNEISFDIHTLPAGNYFMQLKGGVSGIMQFIKQ
jgi:hypothetical protein